MQDGPGMITTLIQVNLFTKEKQNTYDLSPLCVCPFTGFVVFKFYIWS